MLYTTPYLETARLLLKRGSFEDYKKVYEYDFTKLRGICGEEEKVKYNNDDLLRDFAVPYDNSYDWIMYLKDGTPIGNVVADREIVELNSIEIAFNIHPDFWRQGYGTEAIEKIIEFLFSKGYDNIVCGYDSGNFKSKGIGEKLGFILYRVDKAAWYKNGVPIDSYVTILSRERYKILHCSRGEKKR